MANEIIGEKLGEPYQDELQVLDQENSALVPLSEAIIATRGAMRRVPMRSTSRRQAQDPLLVPFTPGRSQLLPAWGNRLPPGYYPPRS
jgi:hypothetical protein